MSAAEQKPAENALVVTPSDSVDITIGTQKIQSRAIYVGGAGNVSVEMKGDRMQDQTVLFTGVLAGTILPLAVTRVNSTLTTATFIVALW